MIFRSLICFCSLGLLSASVLLAQQKSRERGHTHGYTAIDQAYKEGKISLDQKVRYKLYATEHPAKLPEEFRSAFTFPIKCGTPARMEWYRNRDQLAPSGATIKALNSTSHTLQAAETFSSPGGKFSIHYYTSGEDAVPPTDIAGVNGVPDYVEWVAAAADSSWRHEVQNIGFTDPVLGLSQPYHVHILDLPFIYGETVSGGNTTFIRIENDFAENFPPNDDPEGDQRGAIKVTMAHELKHAINYAVNGWRGETTRWGEMDATLMEEVVYDNVNDYYNYLDSSDSIFLNPQKSFYPGSYYHVSWALFFEEKYGPDFWVGVWDIIKNNPDIRMVDAISEQLGSTGAFYHAYIESQLWHYASGPEYSSLNYGFEERANYPSPSVQDNNNFFSNDFSIPRIVANHPKQANLSALYYKILPPDDVVGEVILEVGSQISNIGAGVIAYFKNGTIDTRIYSSASTEFSLQEPGWYWDELEHIGLVLTNSSDTDSLQSPLVKVGDNTFNNLTLSQNYPNPFSLHTTIRFSIAERTSVQIRIYDTIGRLVKALDKEILASGIYERPFNSSDLASGVYFYQLVTDEKVLTKKMTLIK